jgi:SAM-dependent methyltransferase
VPDREISARLYPGMAPIWYFLFGVRRVCDLPDIDQVLHQPYRRDLGPLRDQVVTPERRDFLHAYLDQAPIRLALIRAVECDHLSRLPFQRPILDLGCGDGTFARILFNGVVVDTGVDTDAREIRRAEQRRCHADLRVASIEKLPFESEHFATVFSNSVLEHVHDIEVALSEIHRVLKPAGMLYMTVPPPRCTTLLRQTHVLRRFNAEHVMEEEEWQALLNRMGFAVEHHEPYMSPKATRIRDLMLPTATLSLLSEAILGRPLVFPRLHRVRVRLYRNLLRGAYQERASKGTGTMLMARRRS